MNAYTIGKYTRLVEQALREKHPEWDSWQVNYAAKAVIHKFTTQEAKRMIVARVSNGPYTLVVVGRDYESIIQAAETWVKEKTGKSFTPTYYTDLEAIAEPGVVGVLSEKAAAATGVLPTASEATAQ